MYTAKNVRLRYIFHFAWRTVLFFAVYATVVTFLFANLNWRFLNVPFVPISVVGIAASFYLGFKNNSSYERLWEGRRIWGSFTNFSRAFAVYVLDYIRPTADFTEEEARQAHRTLLYRHIAYLNAVRIQLRSRTVWENDDRTATNIVQNYTHFRQCGLSDELLDYLPEAEINEHTGKFNAATHILRRQSEDLQKLHERGALSDYKQVELGRMLTEFYNQQGACERIKAFPFPRQYAYMSRVFVWIFILMLPLGLLNQFQPLGAEFVWLTIPFSIVISWIFNTMEVVGDTSENPFENAINDVPLSAICRNIEIDLRQMLGESETPQPLKPENNILM